MGKINAAGIFIVRKDKTILICHPTNHDQNVWSIPKGKVEDGETNLEAAIRETYEETNLYLSGLTEFSIIELNSVNYTHGKKKISPFLFYENENSNINWVELNKTIMCNSNVPDDRGGFPEMDGYRWVTITEAKKLIHNTQVIALDEIEKLLT